MEDAFLNLERDRALAAGDATTVCSVSSLEGKWDYRLNWCLVLLSVVAMTESATVYQ